MKGITYTQVAQYCVMIFAYLVPAIFISILITGNPIPQLGFGDTLVNSSTYLLDKLDQLSVDLGFNAYTENTKSNIDIFCALTDDDETNLMSSLLAKKMGAKKTMIILNNPSYLGLVPGFY